MTNQQNGRLNQRENRRQVGEQRGSRRHFISLSPKINVLNDINSGSLSIQLSRSERYNYCPMWLQCLQRALRRRRADNERVRKCLCTCEPGVSCDNSGYMLVRLAADNG